MVLLAVCHADYCFTLFDFGSYGSNNDCIVLSNSLMGQELEASTFNIPEDKSLLGDDVFPLKKWLIKPYPGRNLSQKHKI